MASTDELRAGFDKLKGSVDALTQKLATVTAERDAAVTLANVLQVALDAATAPVEPPGLAELAIEVNAKADEVLAELSPAPVEGSIRAPALGG